MELQQTVMFSCKGTRSHMRIRDRLRDFRAGRAYNFHAVSTVKDDRWVQPKSALRAVLGNDN